MYMLLSIAFIDCSSHTISSLDPYMLRGLIINWSNVLKSPLVTDAYAPGDTKLMKH